MPHFSVVLTFYLSAKGMLQERTNKVANEFALKGVSTLQDLRYMIVNTFQCVKSSSTIATPRYMPILTNYPTKKKPTNVLVTRRENLCIRLLCLLKMLLEQICIYMSVLRNQKEILSEFPKRIARVSTVGVPSLTSAVAVYTQDLSLPMFSLSVISGVTM
jgi:hypothetical protein